MPEMKTIKFPGSDEVYEVTDAAARAALEKKLNADKLQEAVNAALEQAKASGDFNGLTPHIGVNGNWYIGDIDTGLPSRGEDGDDGFSPVVSVSKDGKLTTIKITTAKGDAYARINDGQDGAPGAKGDPGKSAYAYAQDGGYTGTEAEFAAKLADEYSVNPLRGKMASFAGDSICAGSGESTSYLGGYGKIIADRNGMSYENLAKGGATITAETYSSTTGAAKGWICRMVDSMSDDADYAIVEGGINDAWQYIDHDTIEIGELSDGYDAVLDDTTYYGAFESMLKKLITKFQGKKIGYIAVPKSYSMYDSSRNVPNFYHAALECCAKWGVSVCDLNKIVPPFEFIGTLGTAYTADGTHPTYEGYIKYYCDPIEAWMKTLTTAGDVYAGGVSTSDLDETYVKKSDVSTKKAKLTLDDGTSVLIDIVVASVGTTIPSYINRVPMSIDTDGSIYNGTGYMTGYRLSSSGGTAANPGSVVTGFIPVDSDDVVRIWGCGFATNKHSRNYIGLYKADFSKLIMLATQTGNWNLYNYGTDKEVTSGYTYDVDGNAMLSLSSLTGISDVAYIRVCSSGTENTGTDAKDMIVTINEEIT